MQSNSKAISLISLLIVVLGFGFLWFGNWQQVTILDDIEPIPSPVVIIQDATKSAIEVKTLGIEGERTKVIEVVDGDTIKTELGTVRFIGIDTPETKDPRRAVGCFGKEASNKTKELLSGKEVILQKDVSDTDKYNRLLRYIYLPLEDGQILFVNDYLVREGYAKLLTYPPDVKYNQQFLDAQIQAREGKKGLWGRC